MKKVLALVLMLAMICTMMISCEKADELLEKADAALEEAPYKVTMKMEFTTDNDDLKDALSAMKLEVPVIIDGDNMHMEMSIEEAGVSLSANITVVDKVMYYETSFMGQSMKFKMNLTDEQFADFMKDNNVTMPVDYKYFDEYEMEKADGKKVITCNGLNDDGKDMLQERVAAAMDALGSEASYDEISYKLYIEDGKYDSQEMTADYTIKVDGEEYKITMDMSSEYEYDEDLAVKAPDDADSYTEANYEDYFG